MNKIQQISKFFKWLFQIAFYVLPICYTFFWVNAPAPLSAEAARFGFAISFIPKGIIITHPLPNDTKLLGFVIGLIPLIISLLILHFLIRLFKEFERAEIFSSKTVKQIKHIGYVILIGQLLNPIYEALISATLTWHNPPGKRIAEISFTGTNIKLLLTALLIILISWIMAEGHKLKEEQKYII